MQVFVAGPSCGTGGARWESHFYIIIEVNLQACRDIYSVRRLFVAGKNVRWVYHLLRAVKRCWLTAIAGGTPLPLKLMFLVPLSSPPPWPGSWKKEGCLVRHEKDALCWMYFILEHTELPDTWPALCACGISHFPSVEGAHINASRLLGFDSRYAIPNYIGVSAWLQMHGQRCSGLGSFRHVFSHISFPQELEV